VFNFDLPQDSEDYVHRIGRTARIGSEGDAISFACEDYAMALMDIEEYIGHKIPTEPVTDELLVTPKPAVKLQRKRPAHGHNKGSARGSKKPAGRRRDTQKSRHNSD
jgi:ATP-dependent RNA helicase RhlB